MGMSLFSDLLPSNDSLLRERDFRAVAQQWIIPSEY
jgi:hypothetical protein